jgi:hypothetical protein
MRFVKGKIKIGSVEINGTKKHRLEEEKINGDKSLYIERLMYETRKEEKIKAEAMIKINSICAEWITRTKRHIYNTFLTYLQTISIDKAWTTQTYKEYYTEMEETVKKKFTDTFNLNNIDMCEDEYNEKAKEVKIAITSEMLLIAKKYDYDRLRIKIRDSHEHSLIDNEKWIFINNALDEIFVAVRAVMCNKKHELEEAKNKQIEVLRKLGVKV